MPHRNDIACLILAAGLGTRMRPFTNRTPKPLLTVDNEPLLERSLRFAGEATDSIAVNASYLAEAIEAHVPAGVHFSYEAVPLGSAGAIGLLLPWLEGRDLLIINGDTWLKESPRYLLSGWDHVRPRLLVEETGRPSDFGTSRFVGASLLPHALCQKIPAEPSGLYEVIWRERAAELDFVAIRGRAFDCGTPREFLTANLYASGGRSVIHPTAVIGGPVIRSVLLANAYTPPGYTARDEIRDEHNVLRLGPLGDDRLSSIGSDC